MRAAIAWRTPSVRFPRRWRLSRGRRPRRIHHLLVRDPRAPLRRRAGPGRPSATPGPATLSFTGLQSFTGNTGSWEAARHALSSHRAGRYLRGRPQAPQRAYHSSVPITTASPAIRRARGRRRSSPSAGIRRAAHSGRPPHCRGPAGTARRYPPPPRRRSTCALQQILSGPATAVSSTRPGRRRGPPDLGPPAQAQGAGSTQPWYDE